MSAVNPSLAFPHAILSILASAIQAKTYDEAQAVFALISRVEAAYRDLASTDETLDKSCPSKRYIVIKRS